MTNYKRQTPDYLTVGVFTKSITTEKVKILYDNIAQSTAADGMLDTTDAAIYQVPNNKTFNIVGVWFKTIAVSANCVISEGDTENAETTQKANYFTTIDAAPYEFLFNASWQIASGKFITYNPSANKYKWIEMYGYET